MVESILDYIRSKGYEPHELRSKAARLRYFDRHDLADLYELEAAAQEVSAEFSIRLIESQLQGSNNAL